MSGLTEREVSDTVALAMDLDAIKFPKGTRIRGGREGMAIILPNGRSYRFTPPALPVGTDLQQRVHDFAMMSAALGVSVALRDVYQNDGDALASDLLACASHDPGQPGSGSREGAEVGATAALADEIEGVISDLESSGWARAGQCIKTLKLVARSIAATPPGAVTVSEEMVERAGEGILLNIWGEDGVEIVAEKRVTFGDDYEAWGRAALNAALAQQGSEP